MSLKAKRRRSPRDARASVRSPGAAPRRRRAAMLLAVTAGAGVVAALALYAIRAGSFVSPRPNVLLVTIDTLRWDHLGCYGDQRASTPVLDALARRGVRFDTAIAHVPLTAPSHASILTGLTPLRHGMRDNGGYTLPGDVPTLATRLASAVYRTAAFISGFPLDRRFGLASGFENYDDRLTRTAGRAPYTERPADVTTDRVIAWLDQLVSASGRNLATSQGRPWLAWVHYFDPHAPYAPPAAFAARFA